MAIRSKAPRGGPERRFATMPKVEVRQADAGEGIGFRGHAAVFNTRAWIGPPKWGFYEEVAPGAFAKTIGEADVRMLFNHDENFPLARTTVTVGPGSLRLSEDETGLLSDADMIPTSYAADLALSLETGVVSQMSIAFEAVREEWTEDEETGEETRRLLEVKLYDVSPVTYPAFTDTDAALRSIGTNILMDALELDGEKRKALLTALRSGDVDPRITPALRAARTALDALVEPLTPASPATSAQPDVLLYRTEAVRRSMALLRLEYEND